MKRMLKNVNDHETLMKAIEMASPMPIRFAEPQEMDDRVNGHCNYKNKEIIIRDGMSKEGTIKTAAHEMSHAILHNLDVAARMGVWKDRNVREVEAESVSFHLCRHFGIDTFDFSFPYITDFGEDIKLDVLQVMLRRVNIVTRHLTAILEDNIRFLQEIRTDDLILQEDSLVLKVTQPSTEKISYVIVEGVAKEELLTQLNSYHRLYGEKGTIEVNTFLEEQGAKLIPWYDFHGLTLAHPVDFFDMEYTYGTGVTDAAQLPETEQAMMYMDRVEYGSEIFDERDRDLVMEYASRTKDMSLIKEFIKEFAVRMSLFNTRADQKRQENTRLLNVEEQSHVNNAAAYAAADYETGISAQSASPDTEQWKENRANENFFLNSGKDCFAVYQIDLEGDGRAYHYMGLETMRKYHLSIKRDDYQMTYCGVLKEQDTLDSIFEKYNILCPDDLSEVLISVSDVIALNQNGKIKTYFVDSFGFMELRGFIHQAELETARQEAKRTSTKQSVLESLRNRQARLKAREKTQVSGALTQKRRAREI